MTFPAPRFVELQEPHDPRLDALLRLYESAIPARERKSEAAIRAMAPSPVHRVIVAQEGPNLAGFCLLYLGTELALLEYLATAPELRGRGLGAALFAAARTASAGRPLLVEVESDREESEDRALRARRIAFYRRLDCRRLDGVDFILPLPGIGDAPLLDLLVAGFEGATVDAARAAAWLGEIYRCVYGCTAGDPRLAAMIAQLPARVLLA